jgi:hypothetical protein
MNIDTETKALLDGAFGERLRADTAESLGLRSAMSVVIFREGSVGLPAAVSLLIRTALRKGLGELPFGWSLFPTDNGRHELAVWVLEAPERAREMA